jgi:hypothetical protein
MTQNQHSATRPHRWAVRNKAADFVCTERGHVSSFEILVCWDCRECFGCATEGCTARRRPHFPEFPTRAEAEALEAEAS